MTLDFADAHTARIHRDDLLVETRKSPLIFGDQLRIEGRQSIARNFKLDLGGLGENRFSAIAIPAIRAAVFLAVVEMMINLGVQGSFGKRLLQLVEQPVLRKGCLRVGSRQKLIKQLVGNSRLLPSRHTMSPSFPSLWPSHEISDRSMASKTTAVSASTSPRFCSGTGAPT